MATIEQQLALEREMFQIGADRHEFLINRRVANRMESLSQYGEALTQLGLDPLIAELRRVRKHLRSGKPGPGYANLGPLLQMAPHKIAACAMRTIVDQVSGGSKLSALSMEVAEKLWIETMLCRATRWERLNHKRIRGRYKQKVQDIYRLQNTVIWTPRERATTGAYLINKVAELTGLIVMKKERQGPRTPFVIRPSDQCLEFIRNVTDVGRLLCPFALPMVVPPRPWTSDLVGGYYTELPNNRLVKDYADDVAAQVDGTEAFIKAVNLQQSVGWQVNRWVLEHVKYAWDKSIAVGKLMPREGWEIPPYPKHLPSDHPDVTQWKFNARQLHEKNEKTKNRRVATAKQLWIADLMVDHDTIYFPMQLDFRGRFYYRPPFLHPQANDIGRSLLQFANGKPIASEQDADWLRVHGANLYGHSKLSWQARVDWVHQHQQDIEQAGRDPWANTSFWTEADDPWQFLAFCRAYQQFSHHGYGYVCQLPVVLDCTCSGIQHYSALLLSAEMGELVNLAPSDKPQDIYSTVLAKVLEQLRHDAEAGDPHAQSWLQLQPDRSLLKQVVMTVPYSATRRAVFMYCQQWAFDRTLQLYGTNGWCFQKGAIAAMHYMASVLTRQTSLIIGPAKQAMAWFKQLGKLAGQSDIKLQWRSPAGLPVIQAYIDMRNTVIQLSHLTSVTRMFNAQLEEKGLNSKRMANALSPNVIHSMDASHMAFTTIDAFANGVTNLGGIHDCFATTPAEMGQLRDSVRNAFADLYSGDRFTEIADQLVAQLPAELVAKLPPRPPLGNLDINSVRSSTYFIT